MVQTFCPTRPCCEDAAMKLNSWTKETAFGLSVRESHDSVTSVSPWTSHFFLMQIDTVWPNKSPEPTADDALGSAIAVHVASRRWLSFLR